MQGHLVMKLLQCDLPRQMLYKVQTGWCSLLTISPRGHDKLCHASAYLSVSVTDASASDPSQEHNSSGMHHRWVARQEQKSLRCEAFRTCHAAWLMGGLA